MSAEVEECTDDEETTNKAIIEDLLVELGFEVAYEDIPNWALEPLKAIVTYFERRSS